MMSTNFRILSVLGLVSTLGACAVSDADLDGSSVQTFTLAPAAADTGVYEIGLSGGAELAFTSELPATLEITVEGQPVYSESFATNKSTTLPLSVTVPLLRAGRNEIVATLSYNGGTQTVVTAVTVTEPTTDVTLPTFSTAHDQMQTVTVAPAAGWTVTGVEYSVNGGSFMDATGSGTSFDLALNGLDIGDNELVLLVHSDNAGNEHVDRVVTTIAGIVPVFNCDTPGDSMLPTTDLVRSQQQDVRSMVGYFGDPARPHDILFVIDYDDIDGPITSTATIVTRSRDTVAVSFNTRSANRPDLRQSQPYALSLVVDGKQVCQNGSFGDIWDY